MDKKLIDMLGEFFKKDKRRRLWRKALMCVAAIVVFTVTYMLILPAITMEKDKNLVCGMEEHTHTDECYQEVAELICGMEENDEHSHTADCYETKRELICGMEEHTHNELCYEDNTDESELLEEDTQEAVQAEEGMADAPKIEEKDSIFDAVKDIFATAEEETHGELIEPTENSAANSAEENDGESSSIDSIDYSGDKDEDGAVIGMEKNIFDIAAMGNDTASGSGIEVTTYEDLSEETVEAYIEETTETLVIMQISNLYDSAVLSGENYGLKWSLTPYMGGGYTLSIDAGGNTVIPTGLFDDNTDNTLKDYKSVIKQVNIGADITKIGENSFNGCSDLKKVEFAEGSSLTAIGNGAFSGCTNLSLINLEACGNLTSIGDTSAAENLNGVFYNTGLADVTIPSSITYIGRYAFSNCNNLVNVNMEPNSNAVTIGAYAFAENKALESINIENLTGAVTFDSISGDSYAFYNCSALKSLVLPNITAESYIGYLCGGCTSLASIDLTNCQNLTADYDHMKYFINGCSSLKVLDLSPLNMTTLYRYIALGGVEKLILPACLENIGAGNASDEKYYLLSGSQVNEIVFTSKADGSSALKTVGWQALALSNLKELTLTFDKTANISDLYISTELMSFAYSVEKITINSEAGLNTVGANMITQFDTVPEIVWNVKKLNDPNNSSWYMFGSGKSRKIRLTIGENVDQINYSLLASIFNIAVAEYKFEPNHGFNVPILPSGYTYSAPFTKTGYYYADESGNLYRLNLTDKTAALVYANREGSGNFEIPASINASFTYNTTEYNNTQFKVTSIESDVFSGAAYKSITCENADNITKISDRAFADCFNLASINGESTSENVKATFANAVGVGSDLFVDTKITEAPFSGSDGTGGGTAAAKGSIVSVDKQHPLVQIGVTATSAFEQFRTAQENVLATGESATITLGISGDTSGKRCRVYVKITDPDNCVIPSSLNKTDTKGVYYYDVPANETSETKTENLAISYKNGVAPNKKVYVWSVVAKNEDERTSLGNTVVEPGGAVKDSSDNVIVQASSEYHEITWEVLPQDYDVLKAINANVAPSYKYVKNGDESYTTTIRNLSFVVSNSVTKREQSSLGTDYIDHVEFTDIMSLPEGLGWRTGLINGTFAAKINADGKSGSVTVKIGETEYTLCTINLNSEKLTALTVEKVDTNGDNINDNIAIKWTVEHPSKNTEISNGETTITYGEDVIVVSNTESTLQNISNNVEAVPYYTYSGAGAQVNKAAQQSLGGGSGSLSVSKSWVSMPSNMGETAVYKIAVDNNSVFDHNEGYTITDELQQNQYITASDIQKMFEDPRYDGEYLTVIIGNAAIMPVIAGDKTITAVDGHTQADLSVNNTAVNTDYANMVSETIDAAKYQQYNGYITRETITITKKTETRTVGEGDTATTENYGYIEIKLTKVDEETTYRVGTDPGDYASVQAALDDIGYFVTGGDTGDKYTLIWDMLNETVDANTHKEYIINSTVVNALQYINEDRAIGITAQATDFSLPISNTIAYSIGGGSSRSISTDQVKVYNDLNLYKSAYVNGSKMDSIGLSEAVSEAAKTGGKVVKYVVSAEHMGSGAYGILPIVDHMTGIQAVLAPVDNNSTAGWAENCVQYTDENGDNYYVLNADGLNEGESVTYNGVYLENAYADSITVKKVNNGLDTIIKWYYIDSEIQGDYNAKPIYNAIISKQYAGNNNTTSGFSINNEAWANDVPTHRLYNKIGG